MGAQWHRRRTQTERSEYVLKMQGKRALITGGTAGLGAAIAKLLASSGARCAVNYANNSARAEETLASLSGTDHVLVQGSPFTQDGAHSIVKEAIQKLGGLDYIVSNAGWTKFANFKDLNALDEDAWDRCYAANVKSHLWIMQAAEEDLARNNGSCVIIASTAGLRPGGSSMAYSVSKSATIHLSTCLAASLAHKNITVNCVSPGLMKTDWASGFSDEQYKKMEDASALGRIAAVDDVASVAVGFLTNRSVTGQNMEVSAGYAM